MCFITEAPNTTNEIFFKKKKEQSHQPSVSDYQITGNTETQEYGKWHQEDAVSQKNLDNEKI